MVRSWLTAIVVDVLLLAAVSKLRRPRDFVAAVAAYSILHAVPRNLLTLGAYVIPPLELLTAALLLVPSLSAYGGAAALGLFILFYVALGSDRRPVIANCGCWGVAEIPAPRSAYLARNSALALVAAANLVIVLLGAPTISIADSLILLAMLLPLSALVLESPGLVQVGSMRHHV